ncbi:peptidyl-prolyl cis-trans isomerase [Reichenbachiella carrageenanivorans]|uniref:Peptidyl-prolyl cis-trans isomerase n=1 Tax=Reichenbachiella carrageenanivorans TaxID=2979869 RepID=A0ABY6D9A7_9BACT|nr:peptidyl-prolyl cis-trans isomerase [Reichenbachiella carrageenanivorans]UXX80465.1 peptidyl-prolyl cis-trans isomerase [Reichenbachiella carrageenanivorans]
MKIKIYIAGIAVLWASACDQLYYTDTTQAVDDRVKLARVNDIYLYDEDISSLVPRNNPADSSMIVSKYIDSWVKKQLTIARASTELDFDEAKIERKILDYRYALMIHEFEMHYINQHLDKETSDEEIEKYYNEKFENFVLRQNIMRCLFAMVPVEAPQIDNFRKLIRTYPDTDLEEIQSYCYRFASKSSLETELWINFDEVIGNTPLISVQEKADFLKNNSFVETSDEKYYYFIRILDYKISDQIAPLAYIKDDIESILINKKKVALRKELEEEVYKVAKENNEFELY